MDNLQSSIREGIWGLLPLLVGVGALLALFFRRWLAYRAGALFPSILTDELYLVGVCQRADVERLAKIVESHASLLSSVVKSILRTAACSLEERNQLAEESIDTEFLDLKRHNGYFDVFYSTATLIGLLGALVGLIDAFARQAANAGQIGNGAVTAAVAPALCATAAGVLLAILARILGEYVKGLHEKRKVQMQRLVRPLVLALEHPTEPSTPSTKRLTEWPALESKNGYQGAN